MECHFTITTYAMLNSYFLWMFSCYNVLVCTSTYIGHALVNTTATRNCIYPHKRDSSRRHHHNYNTTRGRYGLTNCQLNSIRSKTTTTVNAKFTRKKVMGSQKLLVMMVLGKNPCFRRFFHIRKLYDKPKLYNCGDFF